MIKIQRLVRYSGDRELGDRLQKLYALVNSVAIRYREHQVSQYLSDNYVDLNAATNQFTEIVTGSGNNSCIDSIEASLILLLSTQ